MTDRTDLAHLAGSALFSVQGKVAVRLHPHPPPPRRRRRRCRPGCRPRAARAAFVWFCKVAAQLSRLPLLAPPRPCTLPVSSLDDRPECAIALTRKRGAGPPPRRCQQLVTGGATGIGLMISKGLVANGCTVYISSRKADNWWVCRCLCVRVPSGSHCSHSGRAHARLPTRVEASVHTSLRARSFHACTCPAFGMPHAGADDGGRCPAVVETIATRSERAAQELTAAGYAGVVVSPPCCRAAVPPCLARRRAWRAARAAAPLPGLAGFSTEACAGPC